MKLSLCVRVISFGLSEKDEVLARALKTLFAEAFSLHRIPALSHHHSSFDGLNQLAPLIV